jgi:hypothetical protein
MVIIMFNLYDYIVLAAYIVSIVLLLSGLLNANKAKKAGFYLMAVMPLSCLLALTS